MVNVTICTLPLSIIQFIGPCGQCVNSLLTMAPTSLEKQPLLGAQSRLSDREPSLAELQQDVHTAQRRYLRAWSKTTSGKWHELIMACVTALLLLLAVFCVGVIIEDSLEDDIPRKVPLEAHIMSKCPDARDCLHDLILPTMANVSSKVDFTLSYIGKSTEHDDGVQCMHGSEECLGNIIELCAAKLYPDPKTYLGFTWCLTKDYKDIPKRDLVEDCTLEHGIDMQKLNECTMNDDGELSVDMLKKSFDRSAAAGVSKSCTVRLDGDVFCIRDGGEWKECDGGSSPDELIAEIEKLYDETNVV